MDKNKVIVIMNIISTLAWIACAVMDWFGGRRTEMIFVLHIMCVISSGILTVMSFRRMQRERKSQEIE